MNLCQSQPVSLVSLGGSRRVLSASLLWSLLRLPHRMCLTRVVRGICVVLSLHGRVLWLCLLLDMFYLACVYDAAPLSLPLPLSDNTSGLENRSDSSSGSSSRSSLLSLASHIAAPSSALLPSSLSLSSKTVSHRPHGNVSSNDTSASHSEADLASNSSSETLSSDTGEGVSNRQAVTAPTAGKVRKEFPLALVVASATAAVSILLFFCFSYLWHTRQLDRRAQKLAIRLAAEVNNELQCAQCRPVATYRVGSSQDSGSDSGGEDSGVLRIPITVLDELNSLNEEDEEEEEEEEEGEDGSRRKPGGVGRTLGSKKGGRGRGSRRSSSRSSRKWSGHSCGQTRSSLVTDQEILTHFASRRHSTFFI